MSVVLAFGLASDGQLGSGFESEDKHDSICMVIPRGIKIVQVCFILHFCTCCSLWYSRSATLYIYI